MDHHSDEQQGYITGLELGDATDSLVKELLLSALQDGPASTERRPPNFSGCYQQLLQHC